MADRITELVAKALRVDPVQVVEGLEFQSIPEWDSLGHAGLMLALEDEFGVRVTDDLAMDLTSLRAIRTFVADRSEEPRAGA
ncbi:MAG: acyl carrier protein [Gemmatimonadaceae bacterium]